MSIVSVNLHARSTNRAMKDLDNALEEYQETGSETSFRAVQKAYRNAEHTFSSAYPRLRERFIEDAQKHVRESGISKADYDRVIAYSPGAKKYEAGEEAATGVESESYIFDSNEDYEEEKASSRVAVPLLLRLRFNSDGIEVDGLNKQEKGFLENLGMIYSDSHHQKAHQEDADILRSEIVGQRLRFDEEGMNTHGLNEQEQEFLRDLGLMA